MTTRTEIFSFVNKIFSVALCFVVRAVLCFVLLWLLLLTIERRKKTGTLLIPENKSQYAEKVATSCERTELVKQYSHGTHIRSTPPLMLFNITFEIIMNSLTPCHCRRSRNRCTAYTLESTWQLNTTNRQVCKYHHRKYHTTLAWFDEEKKYKRFVIAVTLVYIHFFSTLCCFLCFVIHSYES